MKKFSILAVSFLATLLFACSSSESAETPKSKGTPAREARTLRVSGYIARPDSTTGTYSASGELVAKNRVELKTETSGRLVKLYASDGARVSKGALLAKLDDSELRANLKSANATLELAKKKESRTRALFDWNPRKMPSSRRKLRRNFSKRRFQRRNFGRRFRENSA